MNWTREVDPNSAFDENKYGCTALRFKIYSKK